MYLQMRERRRSTSDESWCPSCPCAGVYSLVSRGVLACYVAGAESFTAGWNDGTLGPMIPRIREVYNVSGPEVPQPCVSVELISCIG